MAAENPEIKKLFERIVAAVPAESLPTVEKTDVSLVQAYRDAAEKLEYQLHSLEKFAVTEDMWRDMERQSDIVADYKSSAGILEWAKSNAVQYRQVESATALPMLLEVDEDMTEMFLNMEEHKIYIRLSEIEFVPFAGSFYAARAWIKDVKRNHGNCWKVVT